MKPKIIVIGGPTGVGKTALSIALAQHFDGEIINGDALQVYRHLNIGTAKATQEEQQKVAHHLLDIREVDEEYSVAQFKRDAQTCIQACSNRKKLPIIVGGTGLYLESLLFNLQLGGNIKAHPEFRKEYEKIAQVEGNQYLHNALAQLDPEAAEAIHPNNVRRVIRALEVIQFSGQKYSTQHDTHQNHKSTYSYYLIGLYTERAQLYQRINQRVNLMLKNGLLAEAQWLYNQNLSRETQSMKAIGYKELFPYFEHDATLESCVETLKKNSRRYAKRQMTWLNHRFSDVHWFNLVQSTEEKERLFEEVDTFLHGEGRRGEEL